MSDNGGENGEGAAPPAPVPEPDKQANPSVLRPEPGLTETGERSRIPPAPEPERVAAQPQNEVAISQLNWAIRAARFAHAQLTSAVRWALQWWRGSKVDWVARTISVVGLLVASHQCSSQATNARANRENNRRSAQAALARLAAAELTTRPTTWPVIVEFAKANSADLQDVARVRTRDEPLEFDKRAEASRLGAALRRQLDSTVPSDAGACRTLLLEVSRLAEELGTNPEDLEALKPDVRRVVGSLQARVLSPCLVAVESNPTRLGYFVATYFNAATPCDANQWLRLEETAPGLLRVLDFASVRLVTCAEPEVSLPIRGIQMKGCNGVVSQMAAFAPNSTMTRGAVRAAWLPPGPVPGDLSLLDCFSWTSDSKKGFIEMGAIMNGGAFVRFSAPMYGPVEVVFSSDQLNRKGGEHLRFEVSWGFDAAPEEQGISVTVNEVTKWIPRYPPPAP